MPKLLELKLLVDQTYAGGWLGVSLTFELRNMVAGFAIELQNNAKTAWLTPFGYQEVAIYYGDELLLTGRIEKMDITATAALKIEGRSRPAVLIEASLQAPLQYHNVTLATLASELAKPFGVGVDNRVQGLAVYESINHQADQKCFDALNALAEKEAIFLSSTPSGDLLLERFSLGTAQARFVRGQDVYLDASVSYDGSARFSSLTLLSQNEEELELSHTLIDPTLSIERPLVEVVEAADLATLQAMAKRRMALAIAESMKIELTLLGWHRTSDDSRLLRVGDVVVVQDEAIQVFQETSLVIQNITLDLASGDAKTTLSLVLPSLYTEDGLNGAMPWQR
jgi:prophage tail gpP-like protein